MELHYMKVFNTVAQQKSFTKASELLHISQPALSIQIKKLESQLDIKLFNKVKNRITLTEDGLMLYEYTKRIFALVEEVQNKLANKRELVDGVLNIGGSNTPGTYILPEVIGEYKALYPFVSVNLHILNTTEIAHLINNGTLDFAVNGGSMEYNHDICVETLCNDELILVASSKSRQCKKDTLTIKDVGELNFIAHQTDSQLYTYYKDFIDELGIPERTSMSLGNTEAIKRAVFADLGVALLPLSAVNREIESGQLKRLGIENKKWYYPYSLIYNRNKFLSLAAKKLIEIIQADLSNL